MNQRGWALFLSLLLLVLPGEAKNDPSGCATHREGSHEAIFLHRQHLAQRAKLPRAAAATPAHDFGDICILSDADGVVGRRNPFTLDNKTVTFTPANGGYTFAVSAGTYSSAEEAGSSLDGMGDDDTRPVPLPFAFPYFGASYSLINVNSDGNLTFGAGDSASADRSLGRFTAGPPRIAPFYADLNPSVATKTLRVYSAADHVTISWPNIPVYTSIGLGSPQTFQVRLYVDGRVQFSYAGISSTDAIVGISPGGLHGPAATVSLIAGSANTFSGPVAERFASTPGVDIVTAAQKFFETHEDSYDYLVIYNAAKDENGFDIPAAPGAVAYEVTARNNRSGYGDAPVDDGPEYGSASRLQSVLNMGPLSQYPANPDAVVPARGTTGDTSLTVLGHETGHLFLAFASVPASNPVLDPPMLGRALVHWSFNFNSDASFLEGNRIEDDGPGATPRFHTTATVKGYSLFDQYLMGFRRPDEVPPLFYVSGSPYSNANPPRVGAYFDGIRQDVTVNDIIQTVGRRTPDSTVSQRRFRFGFILITPGGADPTADQFSQIDTLRYRFEGVYSNATSGLASADTVLRKALKLSAFPAVGVLQGSTATVTLTLQSPASAALTIAISSSESAIATAPSSVTIPAGSTRASFQLTGVAPGTADLTAQASDSSYEIAFGRIQVLPDASTLKLTVTNAAAGGVAIRATDVNNVPYPGVKLTASVSGGTLSALSQFTDETGTATFSWKPPAGGNATLTAAIDGFPASAVTTAPSLRPAFSSASVVNAASFAAGITPGGLGTIFGTGLAGASPSAASQVPLPVRLGGVQVLLNNAPAGLVYVGNSQINFLAPPTLAPGPVTVTVDNSQGVSDPVTVSAAIAQPGVFYDPATGLGAVLTAGTSQTTSARPIAPGDLIEIYATGLGPLQPNAQGLLVTTTSPVVTIASFAAKVVFSGQAPGFPGLYQVDAEVPAGVPSGSQPLSLTVGTAQSNVVHVQIR